MQDSKFAHIELRLFHLRGSTELIRFDKKHVYEEVNLNAFSMPSGNS